MTTKDIYTKLPSTVRTALILSEGWLVGGSIKQIVSGEEDIKDYDIVVPNPEKYQDTLLAFKNVAVCTLNSFGGMKLTVFEGAKTVTLDIWCEGLGHFLINGNTEFIYSIKANKLYKIQ